MNFNSELVSVIEWDSTTADLHSIKDYLRWVYSSFNRADIFYGHGQDNAWDEAVQLVLGALKLPPDVPTELYDCRLTPSEKRTVVDFMLKRLQTRLPVAYITHSAWFCGLEFYIDERVLVPRSPIAELIQKNFEGLVQHSPQRILDMCTGSGCIAIACADRFPLAEVDAVDLSIEALNVAELNIERHQMLERVFPLQSDLFKQLPKAQYDLIVTNPPYVDQQDIDDMPEEFRHEPMMALEAGQDGLILVKRILVQASDYLSENGVLVCEVGNSMVHLIEQYPSVPFKWMEFENGGDGVFALTKAQLDLFKELF